MRPAVTAEIQRDLLGHERAGAAHLPQHRPAPHPIGPQRRPLDRSAPPASSD